MRRDNCLTKGCGHSRDSHYRDLGGKRYNCLSAFCECEVYLDERTIEASERTTIDSQTTAFDCEPEPVTKRY